MSPNPHTLHRRLVAFAAILLANAWGCASPGHRPDSTASTLTPPAVVPRELHKTTLPPYVIEPPDILLVEAVNLVPKAPYRLRSSDILTIQAQGTLPDSPISGSYVIEPGGQVNLGLPYGSVRVSGMTRDEAERAVDQHLRLTLKSPTVTVSLSGISGLQTIAGEHVVSSDGTITLGSYGSVYVVGQTLADAKRSIEQHLSQFLEEPEIAVDVYAFNSKSYYIITAGAGLGDQVAKFPITGNETVLDALANVNGLREVSSKRIWVARPSSDACGVQVLPVDWQAIATQGSIATNYQLMPGDRLFIAEDDLVALDTRLAKLLAPAERVLGFSLLGVNTVTRFSGPVLRGGGSQGTLGGGGFQ
jgi:polysaccharide export outer membrane protein